MYAKKGRRLRFILPRLRRTEAPIHMKNQEHSDDCAERNAIVERHCVEQISWRWKVIVTIKLQRCSISWTTSYSYREKYIDCWPRRRDEKSWSTLTSIIESSTLHHSISRTLNPEALLLNDSLNDTSKVHYFLFADKIKCQYLHTSTHPWNSLTHSLSNDSGETRFFSSILRWADVVEWWWDFDQNCSQKKSLMDRIL